MKIIPVIDVLGGLVVHAVRGERQNYKPIKSVLCRSADPVEVAKTFAALGFREIYLADLDAILGRGQSHGLYRRVRDEAGVKLMVDAGTPDAHSALEVFNAGVERVVMGTETLVSLDALSEAVRALGPERVVVSLDIKRGRLVSRSAELNGLDPISIVEKLEGMSVNYVILLDMDRIGTRRGVDLNILKAFMESTRLKVMVGGGVGSLRELCILRDLGVYGVLLATALHNGEIGLRELKASGLL